MGWKNKIQINLIKFLGKNLNEDDFVRQIGQKVTIVLRLKCTVHAGFSRFVAFAEVKNVRSVVL